MKKTTTSGVYGIHLFFCGNYL